MHTCVKFLVFRTTEMSFQSFNLIPEIIPNKPLVFFFFVCGNYWARFDMSNFVQNKAGDGGLCAYYFKLVADCWIFFLLLV